MFWLFTLCALSPMALLAAISLRDVSNQLREQSRRELRQLSHEVGMNLFERLLFLDADLKLAETNLSAHGDRTAVTKELPSNFSHRFKGLELIGADSSRQILFGTIPAQFQLEPGELAHLSSGKTLVSVRTCDDGPCVFVVRQISAQQPSVGFLAGEVLPSYLLDINDVPQGKHLCILDSQERVLQCSGEDPTSLSSNTFRSVSGEFTWRRGSTDYEADYWKVFLKPAFLVDHLTVVASEPKDLAFLPLVQFKRSFLLVVLLTLFVVLLLSVTQIRRNLIPLGKLQEGTRRIAGGDFHSRVTVKSGDEFDDLAQSFNSMAVRIEKQFNALKTNNAIDRAILSSWDIGQIVDTLFALLRSVLAYQFVSVTIVESGNGTQARNYLSQSGSQRGTEMSVSVLREEELRELSTNSEARTLSSDGSCPQFLAPLVSRGMRFFLVAPIIVRGQLSAIISLGHSEASVWSEDDSLRASQLADQVGVALSNARLIADLKQLNLGTLTALARAIDAKSPWTSGHSERVTGMALEIGREVGLSEVELDVLNRGGLLHDIGKIGVDAHVLDKPGKLTDQETTQIREHVNIGGRILEPIPGFAECMPIVLQHHEWFDGSGYPSGLAGEQISLHARIFAVADCYDAMISDRPYRTGMPLDRVLQILRAGTGKQFDPQVMDAFLRLIARKHAVGSGATVSEPATAS